MKYEINYVDGTSIDINANEPLLPEEVTGYFDHELHGKSSYLHAYIYPTSELSSNTATEVSTSEDKEHAQQLTSMLVDWVQSTIAAATQAAQGKPLIIVTPFIHRGSYSALLMHISPLNNMVELTLLGSSPSKSSPEEKANQAKAQLSNLVSALESHGYSISKLVHKTHYIRAYPMSSGVLALENAKHELFQKPGPDLQQKISYALDESLRAAQKYRFIHKKHEVPKEITQQASLSDPAHRELKEPKIWVSSVLCGIALGLMYFAATLSLSKFLIAFLVGTAVAWVSTFLAQQKQNFEKNESTNGGNTGAFSPMREFALSHDLAITHTFKHHHFFNQSPSVGTSLNVSAPAYSLSVPKP